MPSALIKGNLFPSVLTNELKNLVRGKSSIARLSQQQPISFNGNTQFTFNLDSEANFVGERGVKTNGGATVEPVQIVPYKVEYGYRTSDEFLIASDEAKIDTLRAFNEGFANKLARALDIGAMHGINPRTGNAFAPIGNNHFDAKVTQTVNRTASINDDIESAIGIVQGKEHEVTGMAMSPAVKLALSQMKKTDGTPYFPDLQWGNMPEQINGLPVDSNSTVAFGTGVTDQVIVGDFRGMFKWGVARDVVLDILRYGNPDNSEDGDLAAHNEVFIRAEAYIGWGILVPNAFARIVNP